MLYHAYELNYTMFKPLRNFANLGKHVYSSPMNPWSYTAYGRSISAGFDILESFTRRYHKPAWNIPYTSVKGTKVPVEPRVLLKKPFCRLIHFDRQVDILRSVLGRNSVQPRVLLIAPMSGHYATLLRGTVEALLPDYEVFITDWMDAKQIPFAAGRFDLNDSIDYLIEFIDKLGAGSHVVAVCQPGPAALAAVSLMAQKKSRAMPASMTFIGSPIDAQLSPTVPNRFAAETPLDWFRSNVIYTVPWPNPGFLRRVYPGFLQLGGFLSMNPQRHGSALKRYFDHLVQGDQDGADRHRQFYNEYLAVQDLTAEFYLQTIEDVLQEYKLARGIFYHRGEKVEPARICSTALMTIEGELDDISGVGQTQAAHTLCSGIADSMRVDYVQKGVGHFGVFNGRRFRQEILPRMNAFYSEHFNRRDEKILRLSRPDLGLI